MCEIIVPNSVEFYSKKKNMSKLNSLCILEEEFRFQGKNFLSIFAM